MKLYNSIGPNPKMVRMYIAERGLEIPLEEVDIVAGENRQGDYATRNPRGQLPCLELDDGSYLAEITAICEYLDDVNGSSDLVGTTPQARAETRMWMRRADLYVCEPLANGFRFAEGLAMFESRLLCRPEMADGLKAMAVNGQEWFNGQLDGRTWLTGDTFTIADCLLYAFLEFGATVGQPIPESCPHVKAWYERVAARPSASA
ncbi:MAG: glutathione S-transferase [Pseudomonadota bacterium]